jgi:hypothetical protein
MSCFTEDEFNNEKQNHIKMHNLLTGNEMTDCSARLLMLLESWCLQIEIIEIMNI